MLSAIYCPLFNSLIIALFFLITAEWLLPLAFAGNRVYERMQINHGGGYLQVADYSIDKCFLAGQVNNQTLRA